MHRLVLSIIFHIKMVHERKRPFNCNSCNAQFFQNIQLKSHIESVHEKQNLTSAKFVKPALQQIEV